MNSVIRINKDGSGKDGLTPCAVVPAEAVLLGQANEIHQLTTSISDAKIVVSIFFV